MNGGVSKLLVAASFAAAGCAAAPDQVEVRPIGGPGAKLRAADDPLAAAKGQLALGNIGLALEGFRKAAREHPDNPEAFAGMAASYEAMRRFDLAETKYQAALALAPKNVALLGKLAAALDQQGKRDRAAAVRGEIGQIELASAALGAPNAELKSREAALAPAQTVSVALPAPKPVAPAAPPRAIAPPPVQAQAHAAPRIPAPQLAANAPVNIASALPRASQQPLGELPTLVAPPAEPVPSVPAPRLNEVADVNLAAEIAPRIVPLLLGELSPNFVAPATPVPAMLPKPKPRASGGPRLERLSLGEVALLTSPEPVWRGQVVASTPRQVTVRWVPLRSAAARPNIRLLNAARTQGLAARSREYLLDRGWRKIAIADASEIRERSLVLYPASHPTVGRSLAAQFGCRAQPAETGGVFIVYLGRDTTASRTVAARG